ncbi:MAG: GH36-type glycosyl hydrolase domain-containing protein [Nevskiales bacterium]
MRYAFLLAAAFLTACGQSNDVLNPANPGGVSRLSQDNSVPGIASAKGNGIFGQWVVDDFGLPAYDYTLDHIADERAARVELDGLRDAWSQVGNDAMMANAYNHGYVQLWNQARLYQWVNRYHEASKHYAGGYGYIHDAGKAYSTLWLDRPEGTHPLRRFGVGYFARQLEVAGITVDESVTAPWGDSPALVHEVTLRNTSSAARNFSWWEYWGVNPEDRTLKRSIGLQSPAYDVERKQLRVAQIADGIDPEPQTIFLAAVDAPVDGFETDLGKFFGSGTRAAPAAVADDTASNSIAQPFLGAVTIVPIRSSTLFALRSPVQLAPGQSVKLRYVYGIARASTIDGLVAQVRAQPDTQAATAKAWRDWLPRADFGAGREWLNRELQWDAYMVRSSSMYEESCGHHVITQGGYYQYGGGQQIAFRDPLQHMLPIIYADHELSREVLRYSFQQQPAGIGAGAYGMGPLCTRLDIGTSNDLDFWLLLSLVEYVLASRDLPFLDEQLPYRGGLPVPALISGSVWEHAKLAYQHQEQFTPRGPNGHYVIGVTGDWSDFSTQFLQMTESVLVSAQLAYLYPRLAELAELKGDTAFATTVRTRAAELQQKLDDEWTGRGWYSRGYSLLTQIGRGAIFAEPQSWALLSGAPDLDQATTLMMNLRRFLAGIGAPPEIHGPTPVGSTQSPAASDPEVSETSIAPQGVGDGNAVYVGGVWYALNGPLVWALGQRDGTVPGAAEAALDEFERNTLAAHAEAYPDRWNGIVNVDDACWSFFSSDPGQCGLGLLITLSGGDYAGQITHQHAWSLFSALKLAGVEPTRDGYRIAPHLPLDGWSLRLPNIGLAQQGGSLRGYIRPAAAGPIKLQVVPRSARANARYAVAVNGEPTTATTLPEGGVIFSTIAGAGETLDWSVSELP